MKKEAIHVKNGEGEAMAVLGTNVRFLLEAARTGHTFSLMEVELPKEAAEGVRIVRYALDHGVTFLDNCWDYNDGESERRMGLALRDGYRQKIFLMTKIDGRSYSEAMRQLDKSLERLQTDCIDLVQHHEILRYDDPHRIFDDEGANRALVDAQKAGKIRYIGFTGHKDPIVHLRMLEIAAKHKVEFDAVQMPLNVMDVHFRSFQHDVLPKLVKAKIGVLGMKTFGDHFLLDHILNKGIATPIELLHYSMNLPTSVVITGIDSLPILEQALEAARTFQPMTAQQVKTLEAKTRTTPRSNRAGKRERACAGNPATQAGAILNAQQPVWPACTSKSFAGSGGNRHRSRGRS